MCGIFSYLGDRSASDAVVRGLGRLEYRGYDSAGVCTLSPDGRATLVRSVGRVAALASRLESEWNGTDGIGIGHTRWATHGRVSEENCHPHRSADGRFYAVHNGIIENYRELRRELEAEGVVFYGQTDSEVAVNLFAKIVREFPPDAPVLDLLEEFTRRIDGAYALVFTDTRHPDKLFGAKRGSPLVLGFGPDGVCASSDSRSFGPEIAEFVTLEDGDIFTLARHDYRIRNGGASADRSRETPSAQARAPELGEYPHFMLKEIHEQPDTVRNVLSGRLDAERLSIENPSLDELARRDVRRITIVASGTSSYAGLVGKYYFEHLAGIETDVCISPEFKYARPFVTADRLFVFVSQSGETADTLECLKLVKKRGGYTFGVVNVPGSSISRLTDSGLHTRAGAEVGVASTKAFTAQVATFLLMALSLGSARTLDPAEYSRILSELSRLPDAIADTLRRAPAVEAVAREYARYKNFFYLGRSLELPVAMEGSIKLKELTYRHAEAYSSGELKHGPIALIDSEFPTVLLNADGPLHSKNLSSLEEVRSRGGPVIGVVSDRASDEWYDAVLRYPEVAYELVPFVQAALLQLFAYYMTLELGNDVDKPRNLAKSVTVE